MDIGASVCKAGRPACEICPLRRLCRSYPRILNAKISARKIPAFAGMRKKKERVDEFGLPNRIYRGRIVEFLRGGQLPEAKLDDLGRKIRQAYGVSERPWLMVVLAGLEKDGLVEKKNGRWGLA